MLQHLFGFKGGVKPQTNKAPSVQQAIGQAPLPERLYVPLHQSIGGSPNPLVEAGEQVLKGQLIGGADGWMSAAVHAPTSGIVLAIEQHVAAHPSGLPTLTVVIAPDGRDEWIARTPLDYRSLAPERVREALRDAGVVGLGGAVFPSHAKLTAASSVAVEQLVINGAECEPFMTCDDLLMRERAEEIVRGSAIFRELLAARRVLIGIEDNKPEAVAAMQAAVLRLGEDHEVVAVPTRYPAGGAKQLIRVLTGKEVPASKRSTELGVQCFNVATAYTAYRALAYGEPVISRIVTLTGNVLQPRNWEVRLGTPLRNLVALGQPKADTSSYLMGGPMMGFEIPDLAAPVIKATNCVIAGSPTLFPPRPPEMPCIRCGACAEVCPHELQPFELYWFARARNFGKTQEYHLFDCIECGCCSYVCPSHIPLVQYFRFAKSEIWSREREKQAAEAAKARFELRNARAEREQAEKAERLARAATTRSSERKPASVAASPPVAVSEPGVASAVASEPAIAPTPVDADALKKATIVAAMERARAQRAAVQPRNTEQLTPQQQREIAAIEARRANLQAESPPDAGNQPRRAAE
ncbi:MAG: electron transport complex subunit RsxC [Candidatus Accumulibacter sp.]|uniref:electron transport complex subunit RsxC n=1 Tax=Accumulibacter sp. TaxID=2053492 RepID=UPI001A4D0156|nr:electron transport complex subunit RsxC [Accumulibacter sp.]MCC2868674.1 electron transport complex subunit RsxC [Candidatus Accumulibacter phosphatis]MBL8400581.1 electron transport complex subunit RsxC [Accumulibacter sp.]MBN8519954.1 electron transport complex subunit RsxC [Accumulibacter sp.]MBO3710352.1 electron transport complex subunit RsxC [Accumulibacter sp.]MCM8580630.1 electron transport complex subunit RsxC [Accumulibacter sp.]